VRDSLRPGLRHRFAFVVPESKTVPALYPEAPPFQEMPRVFATGFLVGLVEWTCLQLLAPHLEPGELTLGTRVELTHAAPTPPGCEVTVDVELVEIDGRRLVFAVEARDDTARIGEGRHERFVVERARFEARLAGRGRR
jgi:fluoroacetyl-CoA thioesterase